MQTAYYILDDNIERDTRERLSQRTVCSPCHDAFGHYQLHLCYLKHISNKVLKKWYKSETDQVNSRALTVYQEGVCLYERMEPAVR